MKTKTKKITKRINKCGRCRKKATTFYLGEQLCQEHWHRIKGESIYKFKRRMNSEPVKVSAEELLSERDRLVAKYKPESHSHFFDTHLATESEYPKEEMGGCGKSENPLIQLGKPKTI